MLPVDMIPADIGQISPQKDRSGAGNVGTAVGVSPPALRAEVAITDGGGHGSSVDWLAPRETKDVLGPLRRTFLGLASTWNMVDRLRAHVATRSAECIFNSDEISVLRRELVSFLSAAGFPCSTEVREFQPFLLDAWRSLGQLTGDIDASLPSILEVGVPAGVVSPLETSGVWCPSDSPAADDEELSVHSEPWRSAADDPELTLERLLQDVAKGHAFELQGGEQEARQPPGKKPRLLGDGSCIRETVSLPTLECIRRLLSLFPAGDEWCAFSFDVRGAHKLVLVRDDEQGLSCFVLKAGGLYTVPATSAASGQPTGSAELEASLCETSIVSFGLPMRCSFTPTMAWSYFLYRLLLCWHQFQSCSWQRWEFH